MICQVLQSGLNSPIVFAGNKHESVSISDFPGKPFKGFGSLALRVFLVHPIEHWEIDRLGVNQLDFVATVAQPLNQEIGQADSHSIRAIRSVKDEDAVAHGVL